jgi:hypothetical protein
MFGPLSIFEIDVIEHNGFHLITSDDWLEAVSLAVFEAIWVLLFLIRNRIRMDNQIEG